MNSPDENLEKIEIVYSLALVKKCRHNRYSLKVLARCCLQKPSCIIARRRTGQKFYELPPFVQWT